MVKVCAFDVPPPGAGFTTVTEAVPTFATRAAVTVAVSCVEETNVVVSPEPFHLTAELATKLVPFTVRVNWALPAVVELGLIEVVVGIGFNTVNVCGFDVPPGPPPPAGVTTVTWAVPLAATSAAGTTAVSCVEETKVVARAEPFQFTFDVEMKFVPFTVRVN
jgi:hypothetical protein